MIMKQLQNNFTTPEQSRRLLDLGLPADSADCYYDRDELEIDKKTTPYVIPRTSTIGHYGIKFYIPCWSVGRLIEIYCILVGRKGVMMYSIDDLREEIIYRLNALKEQGVLDFSKLEE